MNNYNPYSSIFKDERIQFIEESFVGRNHIEKVQLIIKEVNICPNCGSTEVIAYGSKTRNIKMSILTDFDSTIIMAYHRLHCKTCGKLFMDTSNIALKKQNISLQVILAVIEDLRDDCSFKYIGIKRNLATQTVINIFESLICPDRVPFGDVLCVDEFKNLKHTNGKYAFVMFDPNAHKINDVLEDRRLDTIDYYLYMISFKEKDKVKYFISDMNEAYRTVKKRHFPNAVHIIDTFHFTRYVEDAWNDVRIEVQSSFKDSSKEYKILKRYWRILSAYSIDVDSPNLYNPIRKCDTPVTQIIDDAVNLHPKLIEAYVLIHDFLRGIREVKFEDSLNWLDMYISNLINSSLPQFNKLAEMFINWKLEIRNSFIRFGDKRLHNGYIEGINNKIKVIKRISYGYSNFSHFRNRIMHIINGEYSIKMVDTTKIQRRPRKMNK